ncbi:hypothetical protein ACFQ1S_11440 [Kibdelosporangium lantanae]|uniref:Uncharacterized protein n=1 Tax=Kibdelosporangium lantanae TaxID=1497396 RepID=A0ABW3M888_9PSEU
MHIGKKLAATVALVGTVFVGGVVAAGPAGASSSDMGLGLSTGHNVGAYADYNRINNADKVAPDLIYNANRNLTDGVEVDCWSDRGATLDRGNRWYHTKTEYYNHLGYSLHVYAWTYAPYVDGEAGIRAGLQYCNY